MSRRAGATGLHAGIKAVDTPRRAHSLSHCLSPVASLLLFVFPLSLLQLKLLFSNLVSSILREFLDQNQSDLLQEVEESPIYKWVSFRRNFVGSFYHILV
jgi:hypothetical protein